MYASAPRYPPSSSGVRLGRVLPPVLGMSLQVDIKHVIQVSMVHPEEWIVGSAQKVVHVSSHTEMDQSVIIFDGAVPGGHTGLIFLAIQPSLDLLVRQHASEVAVTWQRHAVHPAAVWNNIPEVLEEACVDGSFAVAHVRGVAEHHGIAEHGQITVEGGVPERHGAVLAVRQRPHLGFKTETINNRTL